MTTSTRKANKGAKRSSPIPTTLETNNLTSEFFNGIHLERVAEK